MSLILITIMVLAMPIANAQQAVGATASADSSGAAPSQNTQSQNVTLYGLSITDVVNSMLANLVNTILSAASFIVGIAAAILNVSLVITLNIKDFVNSTPAIYIIWQTIRDITGLFFIFYLLYAAIQMILGTENYGNTIKNIVIAGILINFSFFITSVLIDASNVLSKAIYDSMIPNHVVVNIDSRTSLADISSKLTGFNQQTGAVSNATPGISDVFLNSLKIQSLYDTQGNKLGTKIGNPFMIVLVGIVGVIIMITAALSFILAAFAFIVRLGILLFLLAFSPLWFAGRVIPQVNKYSSQVSDQLYSQLIFMPVYLLLMYAALRILNDSNIMGATQSASLINDPKQWAFGYIVLAINFTLVIFMLNLPLWVGLKMGGAVTDLMKSSLGKYGADAIWKKVGGYFGTNTIGRLATRTDKYLAGTRLGNSYYGRDIRSATIGAAATAKYGGSRSWEDKSKIIKDVAKKSKEIRKHIDLDKLIGNAGSTPVQFKQILGSMNEKEKLGLGSDYLKNIEVAKHLKGSDFEAIKKSDDFSDEDKKDIGDARVSALKNALTSGQTDVVKHMVENMDGKDLMKLENATLTNPALVLHLKQSQLKTMDDEGLDATVKKTIGRQIFTAATPHRAFGFINKNQASWT